MQRKKKSLATLGVLCRKVLDYGRPSVALFILIATLTWAGGAAGARTYKVRHVFQSAAFPTGSLTLDAAGNLYGTTTDGGAYGYGGVFKLAPNPDGTWTESVLHRFTGGVDGGYPEGGLIFDTAGNLYGATLSGGVSSCCGVVFKLAPNSVGPWTESVLYSFTDGADGAYPQGGVIFDAAGNLYGTTHEGGTYGCGVVFKLAPNPDGTWTESVLYSFTGGVDGGYPQAGLIFDTAGNLYGTTFGEGADSYGVVFELSPAPDGTWTESVLHSFTGGADGGAPTAALIFDTAGSLYGTTLFGGVFHHPGYGLVFKLTPTSSGWSEAVVYSFLSEGMAPVAPVIFDPAGDLYGTTSCGSHNNGLVFEITP